ncbi:hypothetical protein CJ010_10270 [Azoarcus sp. DD4]|uniref:hypothetical protein n=1 Tax=Azoarcus sp. DD4 TaxID=2027405 RepID=UPI001125DF5D|nr:hypothetical protein [Azoarcus sp. DD4]QDF96889.1 hypothetical protein CJ010_10270 [Azoarcus sp. DD4]
MSATLPGTLPGGLPAEGGLVRDYAFHPADGRLVLALAEVADMADSTPDAVSRALLAALSRLGDAAPTRDGVDALCVADRQFLMRALDVHLGHPGGWFDARCRHCAAGFDFHLDYADLPAKPAAPGFPYARVTIARRPLTLRVPTGADQIRILREPAEQRRDALLRRLEVRDPGAASALPTTLAEADIARCEAALEALLPEVVCEVAATCPECGAANAVGLDPYAVLGHSAAPLLTEVHRLAWHYHWSEAEILALPSGRRAHYLRLIDAARGMTQ